MKLGILVAACVVAGAIAMLMVTDSFSGEADTPITGTTSTLPANEAVDPADFLAAWDRSLTSDYALDAELTIFEAGIEVSSSTIRQSQLGDRALTQSEGYSFVLSGDEVRQCRPMSAVEVGCEPAQAAVDPFQELAAIAARLEEDYVVYDVDGCWQLVATEPKPLSTWGQASTFCFDEETGAVASWIMVGDDRREEWIATEIRSTVTEEDLTPTVS